MKLLLLHLVFCLFAASLTTGLHADEAEIIATVRAADDERVAATLAANAQRLETILSDQLHYAHSSGKIDTKASFVEALISHRTVYESIEYGQRDFRLISPGVVLMSGRVKVNVRSGPQKIDLDLCYLAVWREENGRWRFLAWQSTKLPPPPVSAPTGLKATITTNLKGPANRVMTLAVSAEYAGHC